MADLSDVLPNFDQKQWRHLLYSLERKCIITAELVVLDPIEIAKRCPLPLNDLRSLIDALNAALRTDVLASLSRQSEDSRDSDGERLAKRAKTTTDDASSRIQMQFVQTLDPNIDEWLGGGFPTGYISEIVGESSTGKTQFVLSLLLSAQLPPPRGLGRSVLYLDTEGYLNTTRLKQMLQAHPVYQDLPYKDRPSLDRILTMSTHDMEVQEHITQYQIPESVRRYDVGLVVIDSVAANFRAEFSGVSGKTLATRSAALIRLGNTLRKIANDHNVAVVVTNQVGDRFDDARTLADKFRLSSQAPSSSAPSSQGQESKSTPPQPEMLESDFEEPIPPATQEPSPPSSSQARREELMSLDFQQRFFTGWGDDSSKPFEQLKTPALGLTWANQINARVVLKMDHTNTHAASASGAIWTDTKRRRFLKVVYAPWTGPSMRSLPYTLEMQGPVSFPLKNGEIHDFADQEDQLAEQTNAGGLEHAELLDPRYWDD